MGESRKRGKEKRRRARNIQRAKREEIFHLHAAEYTNCNPLHIHKSEIATRWAESGEYVAQCVCSLICGKSCTNMRRMSENDKPRRREIKREGEKSAFRIRHDLENVTRHRFLVSRRKQFNRNFLIDYNRWEIQEKCWSICRNGISRWRPRFRPTHHTHKITTNKK